jgi:hypothetical protein
MFKKVVSLTLFFSLISCVSYKFSSEGFYRPKNDNHRFEYKNSKTDINTYKLIDTLSIYYMPTQELYKPSDIYRRTGKYERRGKYIRFFSKGKFKIQGVNEVPKIEDVNNINKGIVGYFKFVNNVLKLEIFTDINAGSNQLQFGIIQEDGNIILLDENPRTTFRIGYSHDNIKKKLENSVYNPIILKKIKMDSSLTYTKPNW